MTRLRIHFVHGGASYLPELAAYREHVRRWDWEAVFHEGPRDVPDDAPVVWWMCGRVPRSQARRLRASFHVHEYASASVPPAAWLKDAAKRIAQPRPQHRVFQSEWVRGRLGFGRAVPFSLRDMGVAPAFLEAQPGAPPEFDFVYAGETGRLHAFLPALAAMLEARLSLLVVGSVAPPLQEVLPLFANVRCVGRVPHEQMPAQLLRARAGLNLMPARLPFTQQTATKVLEYLAAGLPVVSNDYPWAARAAAAHPGRVRLVQAFDPDTWRAAAADLPPRLADRRQLRSLLWEERLRALPVWDAIRIARGPR